MKTTGGNANNASCYFPFRYNSTLTSVNQCLPEGENYWCSTTLNYENDKVRGNCQQGITENKKFKICNRKQRTWSCPVGYLINLVSAQGILTSDGSCDEEFETTY